MGKDIFLFDSIPFRLVTERLMQLAIRNKDILRERAGVQEDDQGGALEANRGTWELTG